MHEHDHEHTHSHHSHDHHHGEGCDCGCGHHHREVKPLEGMTARQQNILLELHARHYLPVASFVVAKAGDEERFAVLMEPVYLGSKDDALEDVKALGEELLLLEDAGLLTLDYDIPLRAYPYQEYHDAALYDYFKRTVAEAAARPDATFDTPQMQLGSMAITEAGEETVRRMLEA